MGKEKKTFDLVESFLSVESQDYLQRYNDELEDQCERIAEEKGIEEKETLDQYVSNMNYMKGEYIVDGALLMCTKAISEVRHVQFEGKKIISEFIEDDKKKRIHVCEKRTEEINGFAPVTVADCKGGFRDDEGKGVNIISFGNCGFLYDGENIHQLLQESESTNNPTMEELEEALGKGMGTCYCFMDLEESWENMPSDIIDQIDGGLDFFNAGVAKVLNTSSYLKFDGKEGINRMSMLFCKLGGGIIMALESGQNNVPNIVNVKERILELIEMENGLELVKEYLEQIKAENPDYVQFLEMLAMKESSGSYTAHRKGSEYLGRYQIGNETFDQINFKDEDGNWIELAKKFGVESNDDFLANETAQEVAILFAIRWDYQQIVSNKDDQHIGETIQGLTVTNSGLIAAGHLVGCERLHKAFIGEITWTDTEDDYHTKALTYMAEMGGLDLSGVLGGIE